MWIKRDISDALGSNSDVVQIIRGPRQCGKSSLVLRLDPTFHELSLDDPALRELAQRDPELFLNQFSKEKLFIDEAQYAPQLFSSIKRRVDLLKRNSSKPLGTVFRLTGSNQILMDHHVKESLAGRASFFDMNTLSVAEILRQSKLGIQEILYMGGWPELHANPQKPIKKFLDDYINSYVEKDIVLSAGIQKSSEFLKTIRLLAGRVGQLLDYSNIANEVGVDSKTIKDWISVLERMHIVVLVQPFSTNLTSRLVKSPKVYFVDTGLACRLQGWTSPEPILTSPQQGALFENLVFAEIFKINMNFQMGWQIFHWRSKDGEEIDFLIQKSPTEHFFIEAKVSRQTLPNIERYSEVKKAFKKNVPPIYLCHQQGDQYLAGQVPIALLQQKLIEKI